MTNYQMLVDAIESLQKQQDELREKVIRHEDLLNQQQIKISDLQNENKILRTNNTDLKKKLVNVFKEHRIQKQQLNIITDDTKGMKESVNRNNRALTEIFNNDGKSKIHNFTASIWYLDKEYIIKYYVSLGLLRTVMFSENIIYLNKFIEVFGTYKFNMKTTNYYNFYCEKNIYKERSVIKLNLLEIYICYSHDFNEYINPTAGYYTKGTPLYLNLFNKIDKSINIFINNNFTIKKEVIDNIFIDLYTFTMNDKNTKYKLKGKTINGLMEDHIKKLTEDTRKAIKSITDRIKVVDDN